MAVQTDFMLAVNQIAAERNIDADDVLEAIKQAIRTGFKKDYPEEEGTILNIDLSPEKGQIAVYADKKVVDDVTNPPTQISLEEAQKLEPKLKVGDHIEVDITPEGDFGRVAAQAAKQVILQKIREAERETVLKEFEDKIGDIETGVVQRMDQDSVLWEVRKATGVMPLEERIGNEFYRSGNRHKLLIKMIEDGPKGKQLIVSRADPEFLRGIFELEVPELISGSVDIKVIAREEGSRSKVAVFSNTEGIDPIGSCVGQKGVRINAIMNELKVGHSEEKIDIILWDDEPEQFIANALSPAEVINVKIMDKEERVVKVIVPDEQLSLAIGKEGQNVRLAAKLTGWKIDIQGETIKVDSDYVKDEESDEKSEAKGKKKETKKKKSTKVSEFESLGLGKRVVNAIDKAGIKSVEDLKEKIEAGEKIAGIGPKAVEEIKKVIS